MACVHIVFPTQFSKFEIRVGKWHKLLPVKSRSLSTFNFWTVVICILLLFFQGMTNDFSTASNCVPGLQSTSVHRETSFFCEPRITGRHLFIKHYKTEQRFKINEVAIFEETKRKFN